MQAEQLHITLPFITLLIGGLPGMSGQGVRVIAGLKKTPQYSHSRWPAFLR